jgi:hypothetical protein
MMADASGRPGAPLFAFLLERSPAVRAKQLAQSLHENPPGASGEPIDLGESLRRLMSGDRRGLLGDYWAAALRAGECHAIAQEAALLEALNPITLRRLDHPHEHLALLADLDAVRADQYEAQSRLLEAQFELTRRTDRPLSGGWLLAATLPHAGPYNLKLEAQAPALVNSWRVKRAAAAISAIYEDLKERATAVVEADNLRATDSAAYQSGIRPILRVLQAIRWQTMETFSYLRTVAEYNRSIAEYSLAVLSPTVLPQDLVQTLVLTR